MEATKKEELQNRKSCPNCKSVYTEKGARYCLRCGSKLVNLYKACPRCKKIVEEGTSFCPDCGCELVSDKKKSHFAAYIWGYISIIFILLTLGILNINPKSSQDRVEQAASKCISDKIVLNPDTICLTMDPFAYKHGIQLTKVIGKIEFDPKGVDEKRNSLGCIIKLALSFKNISSSITKSDSFNVHYKIKDKETGEILYSGEERLILEPIKPNEVWIKSFEVLQCTLLYNGKIKVLLSIDGVEVEELEIKPKM